MSWGEIFYLKKFIEGKRTLGASNSTYAVISSTTIVGSYDYEKKFLAKSDGTIRIIVLIRNNSSTSTAVFRVQPNKGEISNNDTKFVEKILDVEVKKGDIITFSQSGSAIVQSVIIGATVIDGSLGEVIE